MDKRRKSQKDSKAQDIIEQRDGSFGSLSKPYESFNSLKDLQESRENQRAMSGIKGATREMSPDIVKGKDGKFMSSQHPYESYDDLESLSNAVKETGALKRQR